MKACNKRITFIDLFWRKERIGNNLNLHISNCYISSHYVIEINVEVNGGVNVSERF